MSATLIKLASSHRLSPVDGVDEKTGHSYYGSRRPTVSNRTRFLATPKTVTSFLVGANARYHSRSPFLISVFSISAFSLWLHRADTCARSSRQASARFRPRPMTDSPLSARSTPLHFIFADFNSVPLRSDGLREP
jgi:hypothetical protein